MPGVASASGRRGIVATAFPAASKAGYAAFAAGGNAIDAAVAAAWALAVCEPSGSGLGGQTVLLARLASGRTVAIDGHSRAPAAVSRASVSRSEQRTGYRATTVPTTPATLAHVQERYGSLSLSRVLEPARELAEDGYAVTALQSRQLTWCRDRLAATPATAHFLRNGHPYAVGERFRQPRLAAALRRIASHGVADFYAGDVARAVVSDMRRHDGLIEPSDLEETPTFTEREPISLSYRGHEVITIPPPGGGVELLFALRLLEQFDNTRWVNKPERWYRCLADVVHAAFAERERDPAHPDDWSTARAARVLDERRAGKLARRLKPVAAGVEREEPGETTHLCTADAQGNVVSLTQSIQSLFGAKVANSSYGFLYNNYLTTCPRRPHRYRLTSRCLARSNAAPTLVLAGTGDAKPMLTLGAAGSRRIVSSLVHVLSGVLDRRASLADALDAARLHPRLSGRVWLERPAATTELREALGERFRGVELRRRHSYFMGAVQAVDLRDTTMLGVADPRRDGAAYGW